MSQDSRVLEIWQKESGLLKDYIPKGKEEGLRKNNDGGSYLTAWQNHAKICKGRTAGFPWATNHSARHHVQGRQMLSSGSSVTSVCSFSSHSWMPACGGMDLIFMPTPATEV